MAQVPGAVELDGECLVTLPVVLVGGGVGLRDPQLAPRALRGRGDDGRDERDLAIVHAASEDAADEALAALREAITVGVEAPSERPVVAGRIA